MRETVQAAAQQQETMTACASSKFECKREKMGQSGAQREKRTEIERLLLIRHK